MSNGRIRQAVQDNEAIPLETEAVKPESDLTIEQSDILNQALATLKPNQLKAAMLESSGTSKQLIAIEVGVSPQTITIWSSDPNYIKVLDINKSILDKQGREFRVKQVKQIIAPAYVELIERMNDPVRRKDMETRDIVSIVKTMTNEIRLDLSEAADSGGDYNELEELQKRRKFLAAQQNNAIDDLEKNSNIIQLPLKNVG